MENNYKSHLLYPLYLNYAQRSLLGGGKGSFVMDELKAEDPQFYSFVIDEALLLQKDNVTKSSSERLGVMCELVRSNVKNIGGVTNQIVEYNNKREEGETKCKI